MGEKKTSSKVCETGKGFLTSVFLSENYPVISKGTECKIWQGERMRNKQAQTNASTLSILSGPVISTHLVSQTEKQRPKAISCQTCAALQEAEQKEIGEDHIYRRRERHGRMQCSRQQQYVAGKGANLLPQESSDLLAYPAEKRTRILFSFPPLLFFSLLISRSVICSAVCYSIQSRIAHQLLPIPVFWEMLLRWAAVFPKTGASPP